MSVDLSWDLYIDSPTIFFRVWASDAQFFTAQYLQTPPAILPVHSKLHGRWPSHTPPSLIRRCSCRRHWTPGRRILRSRRYCSLMGRLWRNWKKWDQLKYWATRNVVFTHCNRYPSMFVRRRQPRQLSSTIEMSRGPYKNGICTRSHQNHRTAWYRKWDSGPQRICRRCSHRLAS